MTTLEALAEQRRASSALPTPMPLAGAENGGRAATPASCRRARRRGRVTSQARRGLDQALERASPPRNFDNGDVARKIREAVGGATRKSAICRRGFTSIPRAAPGHGLYG